MSEFMFGVSRTKPTRAKAKKMDRICREEGGFGLAEVNVREGEDPSINGGRYQGWFCARNQGEPFDRQLAARVSKRISAECSGAEATPGACARRERRMLPAQTSSTDYGDRLALRPPPEDEPCQAWCWQPERRLASPSANTKQGEPR